MTYRRNSSSLEDLLLLALTAAALMALQVFVIWLAFNFLGRAFSWPRIDFWQAGALYALSRALIAPPTTEKNK